MRQLPRMSIIAFACILLLAATGMVQAQTNVTDSLSPQSIITSNGAIPYNLTTNPLILNDGTSWVPVTLFNIPDITLSDGTIYNPGAAVLDLTGSPLVLSDGTSWTPNSILDVPMPTLSDGTTFAPGLTTTMFGLVAPGDRDPNNGRMWLSNGWYYP